MRPVLLAFALALLLAVPPAAAQPAAPPNPVRTGHALGAGAERLAYAATAGTLPIGPDPTKPAAEIFYVAYTADGARPAERPITFLFNGGPGAASVFLHLGAVGPKRLALAPDGTPQAPPVGLEDNPETWLRFTDLVFVDPVGTGYSRRTPPEGGDGDGDGGRNPFFAVGPDLDSLGAFMRLYLTRFDRWASPKVIAGESYGGFRAAALPARLADDAGIALNGTILVSPVIEFSLLRGGEDYNLLPWMALLPSYALTASAHDRAPSGGGWRAVAAEAERFARTDLLTGLASADVDPPAERRAFHADLARRIGLPVETVARRRGRVPLQVFAKELLRDRGRVIGRYDGLLDGPDPDPASPDYGDGDPSFAFLTAAYTPALVAYLRDELNYRTDRAYEVLNEAVNRRWDYGGRGGYAGAAGDLKTALVAQPDLRALVLHGVHDLVTPYFASRYLIDQMALPPEAGDRIDLRLYPGGHMMYLRDGNRAPVRDDVARFYREIAAG